MDFQRLISVAINATCDRLGVTQRQLATRMKIREGHLSDWMAGRRLPGLDKVVDLAKAAAMPDKDRWSLVEAWVLASLEGSRQGKRALEAYDFAYKQGGPIATQPLLRKWAIEMLEAGGFSADDVGRG